MLTSTIMVKHTFAGYILVGLLLISCTNASINKAVPNLTSASSIESSVVYKTETLVIQKLSDHVYEHTSYLNTSSFGKVASNGMIVLNENEAIVFDTPADNKSSEELINYVAKSLNSKVKAIIPTHFHEDCVGGLEKFMEQDIPAYATTKTIALLESNGHVFSKPIHAFADNHTFSIGDKKVYAQYFGEGHSKDNIIGYFHEDKAVFGGCLIKEVGATKGYLGDANTNEWSETVLKLKQKYPNAEIVIPGHGKWGGTELFDYTIKLFE